MRKSLAFILLVALTFALCSCVATPDPIAATPLFKGKTAAEYASASYPNDLTLNSETLSLFDPSAVASLRIECESYLEKTMEAENVESDEFSGGVLVSCVGDQEEDGDYRLTYKAKVPETMPYRLTMVASCADNLNTTDFYIYLNGEKTFRVTEAEEVERAKASALGSTKSKYIYLLDFGTYDFEKGETEFAIVLKSSDSNVKNQYHFYGDYFELEPVSRLLVSGGVLYDEAPTGEYAEMVSATEKLSVFTTAYPVRLQLDLTAYAEKAVKEYALRVTDYSDTVVYEDKITPALGTVRYTLPLGKLPLGYYTVTVDCGEEVFYQHTFCVITDPSERVLLDDNPFAVMMGTSSEDWYTSTGLFEETPSIFDYASVAKLVGLTWMRAGCNWKKIEPRNGDFDYSYLERVTDQLKKTGLHVLRWVNGEPSYIKDNGTFENSQLHAYYLFKDLAERYDDVVDVWEIWNEQDYFDAEQADYFASFCKACAIGVKDAGTDTSVVFGALCQNIDYNLHMRTYEANGLLHYTDAYNYHYHIFDHTHATVTEFIQDSVAEKFSRYAASHCPDLPVIVTEAGILLYCGDENELSLSQQKIQARYRVTSCVQSIAAGTDRHFWFILTPGREDGGVFGTFTDDGQPYPTVLIESVMTQTLGEGQYLGKVKTLSEKSEAHVFNNGTDDVAVLWSYTTEDVVLHTGGNVLAVTMDGKKDILAADKDGNVAVTASPSPCYLVFDGKAPADLYDATSLDEIKTVANDNDLTVGERIVMTQVWEGTSQEAARASGYQVLPEGTKLTLKILNLNDEAVTGIVSGAAQGYLVEGPADEITIEPFAEARVEFTVSAQGGADVTFMTFSGVFNGSETSPCAAQVHP